MERTIYSKYSNERARQFCIRTDIAIDDAGEKKVYKYALAKEAKAHIARIASSYQQLRDAYQTSGIVFCPCEIGGSRGAEYAAFPFSKAKNLQDILKCEAEKQNEVGIANIINEYIRRVGEEGGERPFVVTEAFREVFGELGEEACDCLQRAGKNAHTSALVSDVDMIFANIFVENEKWQVIDYEWTFDFPIPKGFLIYRALYFAYYQVLYQTDWSLQRLLGMAEIKEDEMLIYQRMEEHFQKYIGTGAMPVRNMQRVLGTRVTTLDELLSRAEVSRQEEGIQEAHRLIRKIQYQVDRKEYQDGSHICSGWAFAKTWDGKCLPVNIAVRMQNGTGIAADITRRSRQDVAEVLRIKHPEEARWGYDCVWAAPSDEKWEICFSLGKKECIYRCDEW